MATEGLKVNFSDQEASSEGRSFDPIPSGEYLIRFTDITDEEVKDNSKGNLGKPYWRVECTVQEGEYADRKLWTNAMLFEGALYTAVQMIKATGQDDAIKKSIIPPKENFLTKEAVAIVRKQRDKYAEERDGDGTPQYKNEIKGFKKYQGPGSVKAPGSAKGSGSKSPSLLP